MNRKKLSTQPVNTADFKPKRHVIRQESKGAGPHAGPPGTQNRKVVHSKMNKATDIENSHYYCNCSIMGAHVQSAVQRGTLSEGYS